MKSSHYLCILVIFGIVSCLLVAGCTTQPQGPKPAASTTVYQEPPLIVKQYFTEDADRYFPMKVGSEWHYVVDVKESGAVVYKETPISIHREMIYPQNKGNNLVIKIEKNVDEQCNSQYPDSPKLQVIKDDFGIFKYDKDIFWIKLGLSINEDTYMINQVTTVDSYYGELCAEKTLFIANKENTGMKRSGSKDEQIYLGKEKINYKYQLIDCMHFKRVVSSSDKSLGELGQEFAEESWYAPDKGLIRMEQKIANKTSMIWELESFKSE
jgi:hypothetical protein